MRALKTKEKKEKSQSMLKKSLLSKSEVGIKCPDCGYTHGAPEDFAKYLDDSVTMRCSSCKKVFTYWIEVKFVAEGAK